MDEVDLAFAGIARQAELIRAGEVTPQELVEVYLRRIERLDPELNAFRIVLAERARAEAEQAAARLKAGDERPLLGVPIAVKDEYDMAGEVTAVGTAAYGPPATQDSAVVARLRAAGAILIGKTHTPELCLWPFTESASWGTTHNPWDLDRTPGGSSGGSAAAVAAGLVGAAVGSDGGGSIRIPSACCHLFGLKPQRGRISLAPEPQHWHHLTSVGPIVRSVRDCALFLDVTQGSEPVDLDRPPPPAEPYVNAVGRDPGRLRIAVSTKPPMPQPVDPAVIRAVHETAERLSGLGHHVEEAEQHYDPRAILSFTARWSRGARDDVARIARPKRLERRTRSVARLGSLIPERWFQRAMELEQPIAASLNRIFDSYDILLTPVLGSVAVETGRWEARGALATIYGSAQFIPWCPPWNITGQPAAAVPAGFTPGGLPLSAQLVARPNEEATLLSLGAQLEAENDWTRRRPAFAT
jgi:amidase